MNHNKKYYISQNTISQKNNFKQLKFREITRNFKRLYKDVINSTTNLHKQYKKLFYFLKSNKRMYLVGKLKPEPSFFYINCQENEKQGGLN